MTAYAARAATTRQAVHRTGSAMAHGVVTEQLIADVLPHAHCCADWSVVRALYHQQIQILDSGAGYVPDVLHGALADAVLRASWSYAGLEEQLCQHALAVLVDVAEQEVIDHDQVRALVHDDRAVAARADHPAARRRPSLGEAIIETCRRLRDVRHLRDALDLSASTGLLIGSTSYGRFYNVRGNRHGTLASDLDLIIVTETPKVLDAIADKLASIPFVSAADVDQFVRRGDIFTDRLDDGRTVFSHKVGLWSGGTPDPMLPAEVAPADYLLSLHLMTRPVLDRILVTSTPRIRRETAGSRRTVKDYREAPRGQRDHVRTFAGRSYHLDLATTSVDGGCLREPRVYYIDQFDAYCPGFYQMMLVPPPDLPWDHLDLRPALNEFRAKLDERVQYEAVTRRHALLRPSLAHVRREAFAPHVIRLLDEGY
ncbi:hypothetical protein [Planosporangium mesophilum]|uniref:Nucleotidyltransferase n=1 Tax=Planosporangium mesophilum TaxID=689768 RepID=A0A8J3WZZ1_9ACTN|nr:hypothetical protein [Planosporangium mesophilum]NJC83633.1 hypothetical protein [Planosporangium mesophilum]GII22146.1 hypothetical protein Pme01_17430 [Planosporangium mesophilum]